MQSNPTAPQPPAGSPPWAIAIVRDIVQWVESKFRAQNIVRLKTYAKAGLPTLTANDVGAMVWVIDDATYARCAWWNGSAWKRSDNSTVA